jgi:hypothetical protein
MITFATAQENPIVLRVMFAAVNVMWIVFNFISKAYVSCVYSAVDLVVSVVSMIVLLRRGNASLKDETKIKVEQNA